jgi:hypothetical protein
MTRESRRGIAGQSRSLQLKAGCRSDPPRGRCVPSTKIAKESGCGRSIVFTACPKQQRELTSLRHRQSKKPVVDLSPHWQRPPWPTGHRSRASAADTVARRSDTVCSMLMRRKRDDLRALLGWRTRSLRRLIGGSQRLSLWQLTKQPPRWAAYSLIMKVQSAIAA